MISTSTASQANPIAVLAIHELTTGAGHRSISSALDRLQPEVSRLLSFVRAVGSIFTFLRFAQFPIRFLSMHPPVRRGGDITRWLILRLSPLVRICEVSSCLLKLQSWPREAATNTRRNCRFFLAVERFSLLAPYVELRLFPYQPVPTT